MSVATREGGVDRNIKFMQYMKGKDVATREGGVDRNIGHSDQADDGREQSPPARVAWI